MLPDQGKLVGLSPETVDELQSAGCFRWILVEADGAAHRPLKVPAEHEPVIPLSTSWLVAVIGLDAVGQPLGDRWVFRHERFARLTGLKPGDGVTADAVVHVLLHENGLFKNAPADAVRIVFCNQADAPQNLEAGRTIARRLSKTAPGAVHRLVVGQALFNPPVLKIYDWTIDAGEDILKS
jgi:probable selenium-dependent hydroxylase accessory protein YqeC